MSSKDSCTGGKPKLKKGLWSPEEDDKLIKHIQKYGPGCWSAVPKQAGECLQRCGKSCRLRWINYLRPDLKRGAFSPQEEEIIIALHAEIGNRWSQIAARLPGRTDNEIKNFWNSCLKKHISESAANNVVNRKGSENTGLGYVIDAPQRHMTISCENPRIDTKPRLSSVVQPVCSDPVLWPLNGGTDFSRAQYRVMESHQHVIWDEGSMLEADMAGGAMMSGNGTRSNILT